MVFLLEPIARIDEIGFGKSKFTADTLKIIGIYSNSFIMARGN
jgi:hypothetical protein